MEPSQIPQTPQIPQTTLPPPQKSSHYLTYISLFLLICFVFFCVVNLMMYLETKSKIHALSTYTNQSPKKEYAIVLGASVYGNRLSHVLQERVDAAIVLYKKGLVKKILMSGDGLEFNYNEPNAMKNFAIRYGIPAKDIYTDRYGFNTYDSMYRSKIKYDIKDAYIISQSFHVGRAIWLARHLGIDANGVTVGKFKPFSYYTFREIFARFKDFWQLTFRYVLSPL